MPQVGVIYAVTGERYRREALKSARSVKQTNPDLPITIFSDERVDSEYIDNYIDISTTNTDLSQRPKVACLSETPYDRTIYLDSDTYVTGDLTPLLDLLSGFDIGTGKVPLRRYEYGRSPAYSKKDFKDANINSEEEFRDIAEITAPPTLTDYNTGVLVYELNSSTSELFDMWSELYKKHSKMTTHTRDQPAFREAVFRSDIKITTLPPEYNCWIRALYDESYLQQYIVEDVRIFHGRPNDMEDVAKKINDHVSKFRAPYVVKPKTTYEITKEKLLLLYRSTTQDGLSKTYERLQKYVRNIH